MWKKLKSDGSKFYSPIKIYEKSIFKKADAVTTISMEDYQYAVKYVDKNLVHYLPPGVDTEVYKPEGSSYDFGDDKYNLLFYLLNFTDASKIEVSYTNFDVNTTQKTSKECVC